MALEFVDIGERDINAKIEAFILISTDPPSLENLLMIGNLIAGNDLQFLPLLLVGLLLMLREGGGEE
jgi:hypothetical protein